MRVLPAEAIDGSARSTAVLTLAAFELGELEIPAFDLAVVDPDGGREVLTTDRYGIEVQSVGVDESGDIRDIRGPLGIPMGVVRMALWVLLPLVLAALLYVVARRLRPREQGTRVAQQAPLEPPAHEIALAALAELEASSLLERGQVKEYHIAVSDILRAYLERRFRVDALEMTTREVLAGLRGVGAEESFTDGLRAFLEQCDLVKFAKVRPGPDVSKQVLELGRRLILASAPKHGPGDPAEAVDAPPPTASPESAPEPARATVNEGV